MNPTTLVTDPPLLHRLLSCTGGLRFRAVAAVRVTRACLPGVLRPPPAVYLAGDGRALAWFGDGRPGVAHPTLDELCRMHGVELAETLAA